MIGPYLVTTDWRRRRAWGEPCASRNPQVLAGRVKIWNTTHKCNVLCVEAFTVFDAVREHHNYHNTGTDTGFYSCRHMRHDPNMPMTSHSWAMTIDINWLQNPAGNKLVTDMPRGMIDDLLDLRTNSDARLFRWGGDWDWDGSSTDHSYIDAMHWECVAHPLDLATGIRGYDLRPPEETDIMALLGLDIGPMGAPAVGGSVGDPLGDRVESLQLQLMDRGHALPRWGADRQAGDESRTALAGFQIAAGVSGEPGVVGPKTDAALNAPGGAGDTSGLATQAALDSHTRQTHDAHHG